MHYKRLKKDELKLFRFVLRLTQHFKQTFELKFNLIFVQDIKDAHNRQLQILKNAISEERKEVALSQQVVMPFRY